MDQRRAEDVLAIASAADAGRGRADDTATQALRAAADDLEAAAQTLVAVDPSAALELVAALAGFWQDEGRIDDGRALTQTMPDPGGEQSARREALAARLGSELFERHLRTGRELSATAATERARSALGAVAAAVEVPR